MYVRLIVIVPCKCLPLVCDNAWDLSTASKDPQVILFIGNYTHSTYAHVHHQTVFMTMDRNQELP